MLNAWAQFSEIAGDKMGVVVALGQINRGIPVITLTFTSGLLQKV